MLCRGSCEAAGSNLLPPIELDADATGWNLEPVDAVFTANTLHILSWSQVVALFERLEKVLVPAGILCVYGPFQYRGHAMGEGNRQFEQGLNAQDPRQGIREFEAVNELAAQQGLALLEDLAMPANNRMLIWRRGS